MPYRTEGHNPLHTVIEVQAPGRGVSICWWDRSAEEIHESLDVDISISSPQMRKRTSTCTFPDVWSQRQASYEAWRGWGDRVGCTRFPSISMTRWEDGSCTERRCPRKLLRPIDACSRDARQSPTIGGHPSPRAVSRWRERFAELCFGDSKGGCFMLWGPLEPCTAGRLGRDLGEGGAEGIFHVQCLCCCCMESTWANWTSPVPCLTGWPWLAHRQGNALMLSTQTRREPKQEGRCYKNGSMYLGQDFKSAERVVWLHNMRLP